MMKSILIQFNLFVTTVFTFGLNAQSFIEICPTDNMDGTMVHCATVNDTLYGTGFFTEICGTSADYVAKWDGTNWLATSVQLSNPGHTLKSINNELFIGAYIETIDSNWLYHFDGSNLNKWGDGVYLTTATGFSELPNIYDIVEFNSQIYVCGEFDKVGGQSISGIMKWNGSSWEDVGGGLLGNIQGSSPLMYPHQMYVHNNELYIVGNFRYAGGIEVNGVAKWDGTTWTALGSGFNSTVYAVGSYSGELFVGGDFTQSGSQALGRIAKWDGTDWISPGFGFEPQSTMDYTFVHTFLEENGGLFILGGLKQVELDAGGTLSCGGIIQYFTPTSINTFNGGVTNMDLEAIGTTISGQLLIGGGVYGNGYTGILDDTVIGINELPNNIVSVFPNPMRNVLDIRSQEPIESLALFDNKGRRLAFKQIDEQTIDVAKLEAGIYILHYQTKTSRGKIRLVK